MGGYFSGFAKGLTGGGGSDDLKPIRIGKNKKKSSLAPNSGAGLGPEADAEPEDYRKGGRVRKGGIAKLERGEHVLTKRQAKQLKKMIHGKRA